MLELKVDPFKDSLLGPAMRRASAAVHGILGAYESSEKTRKDAAWLTRKLEERLTQVLSLAVERGYDLAIKTGRITSLPTDISSLKQAAKRRAILSAKLIAKTTKNVLDVEAAVSKKNVASKERAAGIVDFESPKMFFMGQRKAWTRVTGSRMPTKRWYINSSNPCELCQENEDEGPIPVDEPFPSGDYEPGIHPGCDCILGLYV